jgi:hypothetical protein
MAIAFLVMIVSWEIWDMGMHVMVFRNHSTASMIVMAGED